MLCQDILSGRRRYRALEHHLLRALTKRYEGFCCSIFAHAQSFLRPLIISRDTYLRYAFSRYALLRYAFSCYAFSRYAYLHYAFSRYAYLPYAFSRYAFPCYAFSRHIYLHYAFSRYIYLRYAFSCYTFSRYAYLRYAFSLYAYLPHAFSVLCLYALYLFALRLKRFLPFSFGWMHSRFGTYYSNYRQRIAFCPRYTSIRFCFCVFLQF